MSVSREKLYEEIWAEPITKVSKRYGVSDSFLIRVLQRLNIPRPPMGYWAKLAVGKQLPRPALPEAQPGDELEWSRDSMPRRAPRALPEPPQTKRINRARLKADRPSQHALLAGARVHFDNVRETETGHLKPTKKLLPDVIVTKGTLDRAIEVATELFLLLEDHGYRVLLAPRDQSFQRDEFKLDEKGGKVIQLSNLWNPGQPTVVFIGTVAIGLTLFETTAPVEMRYINGKYVPESEVSNLKTNSWAYKHSWTTKQDIATGRLCLQAYSPYRATSWNKQWHEAPGKMLDGKLKTIVKELVEATAGIASQVAEAERQAEISRKEWAIQRERWEREEAERKRSKALKESREELLSIIDSWNEARKIDEFFSQLEHQASELPELEREQVMERIRAAKSQVGSPDALRRFLQWKNAGERLGLDEDSDDLR